MKTSSVVVEQAGQSDKLLIDQVTDMDSIFDEVSKCKFINYSVYKYELASLAHSFYMYTCLKHQLMHQLYSSALPWMMLDPRWIILADHVTLSIS